MTEHKPWLSLPDEDPPERGLAELMAAARAKAEVMASPPWWKRLADVLKRPPVLALATVVVLIGGVIIVHKQPAEIQAPVATPPPAAENAPAEPGVAQPPPPADTTPPAHIEKKAVAGKNDKAAQTKGTETKTAPSYERLETGSVQVDLVPKAQVVETPAAGDVAKRQAENAPVVDDIQQGRDDTANAETAGAVKQPVQRAQVTKKPAPGASLARCREAAANKDCAGARACAKQIETESPAFYKANVANDAALKPCL